MLALPALDFVDAEMPGPVFRSRAIPGLEKRALGAARRPPAHGMAHGRVTGRHRLTIQAHPLPEPPRQPGVGSANPTRSVRMPQCRHQSRRSG